MGVELRAPQSKVDGIRLLIQSFNRSKSPSMVRPHQTEEVSGEVRVHSRAPPSKVDGIRLLTQSLNWHNSPLTLRPHQREVRGQLLEH